MCIDGMSGLSNNQLVVRDERLNPPNMTGMVMTAAALIVDRNLPGLNSASRGLTSFLVGGLSPPFFFTPR